MTQSWQGNLDKMAVAVDDARQVQYHLSLGEQRIPLNPLIGSTVKLEFAGQINCCACGRKTNKSFNQGYCFPCTQSLAQCDICIVRPEKCHYALGTCREPEWAQGHCLQPHFVYLANSSGLKVGITRQSQIPTRWIDQGAAQAVAIYKVQQRLLSGLVEVIIKNHMSDRTDWRRLLKGEADTIDLQQQWRELQPIIAKEIDALRERHGEDAIQALDEQRVQGFHYPVQHYPAKVTSLNLDKTPVIEGELQGIKGQYLLLDCGVINLRKYTGYHISFSA